MNQCGTMSKTSSRILGGKLNSNEFTYYSTLNTYYKSRNKIFPVDRV